MTPMTLQDLMGGPQPDPEAMAAMQRWQEASLAAEIAILDRAVRFAAFNCACKSRYSWLEPVPAQLGCPMHGQLMMAPDGRLINPGGWR